jgi:polar amino acid transport system substrate-binding protein
VGTALRAFAHPTLLLLFLALPAMADKLDDVKARGKLVIGVAEASPPFSFRNGEQGIVGYDVDLSAAVAKRLGVSLSKVAIINAERIPSLRDGKVDIVAMGMTRSPGRAKEIDFSVATLVSPHKILVRRDSGITKVDALAGRTLALVRSASVDRDLKDACRPCRSYSSTITRPASRSCRTSASTASWPTSSCCCGSLPGAARRRTLR